MCDRCVEFGGRRYHRRSDGYFVHEGSSRTRPRVRRYLHRDVWAEENGEIPKGFHIHHRDEDRGHNAIDNLFLMPHGDHARHHRLGKESPTSVSNGRAVMEAFWSRAEWKTAKCIVCGAEFQSRALVPSKFCSVKCSSEWHEPRYVPERKTCACCGASFVAKKRAQRFCSRACNSRANGKGSQGARVVCCAECGSCFPSNRKNARFCGRECALAYHDRSRERRTFADL